MHPLANIATQAARNASKIILRYLDRLDTVKVNEKSQNDFVTEVDKLAEQEIIQVIHKAYPNHAILAEESGSTGQHDYCWIIDPLDGTNNFVHGFPHFSISIAVQHKNQLEVGVIYDPMRQELFTAARGQGAQLNHRRIRVSNNKHLNESLIGTGFPFRNIENLHSYMNAFAKIFPQTSGIRRAGSAALDLAYVASGRLDGFWESALHAWDIAAGALMIREAGGMISDFHGENHFMQNGDVLAGNPKIHKALMDALHNATETVVK